MPVEASSRPLLGHKRQDQHPPTRLTPWRSTWGDVPWWQNRWYLVVYAVVWKTVDFCWGSSTSDWRSPGIFPWQPWPICFCHWCPINQLLTVHDSLVHSVHWFIWKSTGFLCPNNATASSHHPSGRWSQVTWAHLTPPPLEPLEPPLPAELGGGSVPSCYHTIHLGSSRYLHHI